MGKVAKLIMVTGENNNKYYNMKEENNGTFSVEYGRVDVTKIHESYNISLWDKKYKEKLKKGYVDQTHLFADTSATSNPASTQTDSGFADISDPAISQFINMLQTLANKQVQNNYTISTAAVTQKQIDAAQDILNHLSPLILVGADINELNHQLLDLFKTLPRRMAHVQDYLFHPIASDKDLQTSLAMLSHEQDLLDTMKGQVQVFAAQQKQASPQQKKLTLLEAMGLEFFNIDSKEQDNIIKYIEEKDHKKLFKKGFRVVNHKTQKRFDEFLKNAQNKKTELFWHGSRNENWWSISDTGLVLRPTNAIISGKMYGYGLYFANKFRKSLGYTSYSGSYWARGSSDKALLSLFNVHLGNSLVVKNRQGKHGNMTEKLLKQEGNYDSLYAPGGYDLVNDEFIVYNEAQCTINYMVEIGGK